MSAKRCCPVASAYWDTPAAGCLKQGQVSHHQAVRCAGAEKTWHAECASLTARLHAQPLLLACGDALHVLTTDGQLRPAELHCTSQPPELVTLRYQEGMQLQVCGCLCSAVQHSFV